VTDTSIAGTSGNDAIDGGTHADVIAGNAGADTIYGGTGSDFLLGNLDDDVVYGEQGRDVLYGGLGSDVLYGANGSDVLSGDFGADTLIGGNGGDTFYFDMRTAGHDHLGGLASDTISDFSHGDKLLFGHYTASAALMFTQSGSDTLVYVDADGNGSADYLAVTVINAAMSAVQSASSFGELVL